MKRRKGTPPARKRRMKCKTSGKVRYRTELDAKIVLMKVKDGRRALEKRAYLCPTCRGFHLTSQSIEEYNERRADRSRG